MSDLGSITNLVAELIDGDNAAARTLWEQYFEQLVALARRQMQARSWGPVDEEDVALSALLSFLDRRVAGGFGDLASRDEVWKILAVITRRKALSAIRRETAARRGGQHRVQLAEEINAAFSQSPEATQVAELLDEANHLINHVLPPQGNTLRDIALGKLQGLSNQELAGRLSISKRTVERKLDLIRILWDQDLAARE